MAQVPLVTDPTYEGDSLRTRAMATGLRLSPLPSGGDIIQPTFAVSPRWCIETPPPGSFRGPLASGPRSCSLFPPGSSRGPLASGPGWSCVPRRPTGHRSHFHTATSPRRIQAAGGGTVRAGGERFTVGHLPEGKSGAGYAEGVVARRRVSVRHGLGGPDAGPPPTCPSSLKRGLRGASRRAACWTLESKVKGLRDGRVKGLRE